MLSTGPDQRASHSNQSTEKALAILEALAYAERPMRLTDLAEQLQLNASTALRFLSALISCGYAAQEAESGKYYLTYKICRIANNLNVRSEITRITHPYLVRLSGVFHESACVSIEQGMQMVYVDVSTGQDQVLLSMQRVGNTSPMHCTGNGKLLLTTFSDEQIDRLIAEKGLQRFTKYTITTKEALKSELERVKRDGFARDSEESEIGVRCIAYPLYNYTGKIIAGISITGPTSRLTDAILDAKRPELAAAARAISAQLGFDGC